MKEKFDKYNSIAVVLAGINIIVGVILFFILKGDIPIQWNGNEVSTMAEKSYILVFPVIAVILIAFGRIFINYVSYKWFRNTNNKIVSFVNMFLQIILLTIQLYIVLYIQGMRITIGIILLIELAIGVLCGIKLKRNMGS